VRLSTESFSTSFTTRQSGSDDVTLVAEVADSSLGKDRGEKLLTYGRGGVPVYWIVNLIVNQIEVYSEPDRIFGILRSMRGELSFGFRAAPDREC
jgi:Uma2 family endonuclease